MSWDVGTELKCEMIWKYKTTSCGHCMPFSLCEWCTYKYHHPHIHCSSLRELCLQWYYLGGHICYTFPFVQNIFVKNPLQSSFLLLWKKQHKGLFRLTGSVQPGWKGKEAEAWTSWSDCIRDQETELRFFLHSHSLRPQPGNEATTVGSSSNLNKFSQDNLT